MIRDSGKIFSDSKRGFLKFNQNSEDNIVATGTFKMLEDKLTVENK